MDYKEMIKAYADAGGDEKKMWAAVEVTNEAMNFIKGVNPEKFECYMRKVSETLNGKHYTEELARADVEKMHSTGSDGITHHGAHWSVEEVESATADKTFGKSVTKWDKYVAYNATWHDLSKKFDDEKVLCAAYLLWFADEDWKSSGKIWDYMSINK